MAYKHSKNHPGWIYDSGEHSYISPKGRLAVHPGAKFHGTLSKEHHLLVKERADDASFRPSVYHKKESQVAPITKELTAKIVKTVTIGDVTINWIVVS